MKVAVVLSGLLLLAVVDYCTANNCQAPWVDVSGQCMICSNSGAVGPLTGSYASARTSCLAAGGDLATVANTVQHGWIISNCGANPWIGYANSPTPHFVGDTSNAGAIGGVGLILDGASPGVPDCFTVTDAANWQEQPAGCTVNTRFVCSQTYMTCPNLDTTGFASITYLTPGGVLGPAAGPQCFGSTATYACLTGFEVSGTNPRTCGAGETWSDTRPTCVHVGICTDLTEPDNAGITYSDAAHANTMRIIGTAAVQMCDEDYEMTSGIGSVIRTCMAGGSWSGSAIVCEKDNDNALAIGLGVGLGVLALIGLLMAVLCCCCRPMGGGARPVPVPMPRPGYPRPVPVIRAYPRRVGRRQGYPY